MAFLGLHEIANFIVLYQRKALLAKAFYAGFAGRAIGTSKPCNLKKVD